MPARLSRRACLAVALIACLTVSAISAHARASTVGVHDADSPSTISIPLIGGVDDLNREERDERDERGNYALERRYDRDRVSAGFVVAEWRIPDDALLTSPSSRGLELVIRGHLQELDFPSAHPDSVALTIEAHSDVGVSRHTIRAGDLARRTATESHGRYQIATVRFDGTVRQVRVVFAGSTSVAIESVSLQSRSEGGSGR
jgi:hypothetical protein